MEEVQIRLQLALGAARMGIWDSSVVDGRIEDGTIYWSADGAALLGLPREAQEQSFRAFLGFVHPEDRARILEQLQHAVDECRGYHVEYRIRRLDGTQRWLSARATALCEGGLAVRTLGIIWDDSERKQQEMLLFEQKELAEVTLGSIGDGVITTDAHGRIRFLNRVAEQLTGWTSEQVRGRDIDQVVRLTDEASGARIESPAHKSLRLRQSVGVSGSAQIETREGTHRSIEDSAAPIWGNDGQMLGTVMVLRDVSHQRKLARQVSWQATHDALTGLINRREFELSVAEALHNAKSDSHHHALLYLDLDRFKIVNDTCGHGAGDTLLQTLARILQEHMRESDILARLGGDELGVLLRYCPLPRALARADEIRQAIKDFRFIWGERTFELGVSIGLIEIDADSTSMTELMVAADQACYMAKEQGRNRVHVYRQSDQMLARRQGELQWVARLNEAFALNRFRLFAQPIVALNGAGDGTHHEVLVRIASASEGLILPGAFIPAAERYDLMVPLDRWVIEHLCRHMGTADGADGLYSVNLSGTSLNDDGMFGHIRGRFEEYEIDPARICFEITETAIIANLPKAQEFMARLRALGCRFSLDDFGSGLSSFAYLRSLPVDFLKIDGVFIRGISENKINRAMVKAINEVGHVMGIRTVAEYVEDDSTLAVVRELGIDYAQGYALGSLHQLSGA